MADGGLVEAGEAVALRKLVVVLHGFRRPRLFDFPVLKHHPSADDGVFYAGGQGLAAPGGVGGFALAVFGVVMPFFGRVEEADVGGGAFGEGAGGEV